MASQVYYATVLESSPCVLMTRARKLDGSYITIADVAAITAKSFDTSKEDGQQLTHTWAPAVELSVYNTLQTDARFTQDNKGYNIAVTVPALALPDGNRTYRVEVKMTIADGYSFYLDPFDLKALNLLSE